MDYSDLRSLIHILINEYMQSNYCSFDISMSEFLSLELLKHCNISSKR